MAKIDLYVGRKKIKTKNMPNRPDLLDVVNSWNRALGYSGSRRRWQIRKDTW